MCSLQPVGHLRGDSEYDVQVWPSVGSFSFGQQTSIVYLAEPRAHTLVSDSVIEYPLKSH